MIKYLLLLLVLTACSSESTLPVNNQVPQPFLPQEVQDEMESEATPTNLTEPEVSVMAPENPIVFYTATEAWHQPEGVRRPVPEIVVQARVQFDTTGAQTYGIVKNGAITANLTEGEPDHTFQFKLPGLLETMDRTSFPKIQIRAKSGEAVAISDLASWVME